VEERRALYKEKAATPPSRPAGPSIYDNGKGIVSFRTAQHKFLKNRRLALGEMEGRGFTGAQVAFIRDGMVLDGWNYHDNLPARWMYKQYNHKIKGVDKDVVDYLAPNGTNMRSKKSIKDRQVELGLGAADLQKLIDFWPSGFQENRILENPDSSWVHVAELLPAGWKLRKYNYNNSG
jgi:hypothetical protein